MKNIHFLSILILLSTLLSCDKMEDNYKEYLERNQIYSPRVTNLTADVGLKQALIMWDNPQGNIAKKTLIDYQDSSLMFDTMVDSVFLDSLEIKGYTVSVYTIDEFNNYSVPTQIQIFPNGEQ